MTPDGGHDHRNSGGFGDGDGDEVGFGAHQTDPAGQFHGELDAVTPRAQILEVDPGLEVFGFEILDLGPGALDGEGHLSRRNPGGGRFGQHGDPGKGPGDGFGADLDIG